MVNIHVIGDRSPFKSKKSVEKLKAEIKELGDHLLIDKTKFLKEGNDFEFREEEDNLYISIKKEDFVWGDNRTVDQINSEIETTTDSVHIIGDKNLFVSKAAIQKFKNELKEFGDPLLIDKTKYLKSGLDFKFEEDGNKLIVDIEKEQFVWGDNREESNNSAPQNAKDKLKQKLKFLQDQRTGKHNKEINEERKNIDKALFKKFMVVKNIVKDFPITKPSDLINNPEKHKGEVQVLASGLVKITGNESVDKVISRYYRDMLDMLGFDMLTEQELKQMLPQSQQQSQPVPEAIPEPINLNSYVDSDTESDSDVEDIEA